jgi:hypothetical protein
MSGDCNGKKVTLQSKMFWLRGWSICFFGETQVLDEFTLKLQGPEVVIAGTSCYPVLSKVQALSHRECSSRRTLPSHWIVRLCLHWLLGADFEVIAQSTSFKFHSILNQKNFVFYSGCRE